MANGTGKPLRVLHLASFAGNIGDLANHAGARHLWRGLGRSLDITELEIREFYWKQRSFDDAFIEWANSFDLFLVGGGNYFELWVEHSATGMSIDITPERLARLTVATVFYSLGADIGQGYSPVTQSRFRTFMDHVLGHPGFFVCVRNDGSSAALEQVLGSSYASQVPVMPDGGFWAGEALGMVAQQGAGTGPLIGINIAGDMLERRFEEKAAAERFLPALARSVENILEGHSGLRIVLFPHIWRDVQLISGLLPHIKDPYLRRRIRIAALDPTAAGLPEFLQEYSRCQLILGMRFHANVCPIGMGVPAVGLYNYPQIELLYGELGLADRIIDVRKEGFSTRIEAEVQRHLQAPQTAVDQTGRALAGVRAQAHGTLARLGGWLDQVLP
ncbi:MULTISPECIES: polysaccharide pyruvyl transferase family protein [unclassified Pannonibacter]|uniref:polysaccharide pyruvyl transferase family protein n=1 Tax=unclassified Pannonibacter TaxID=2627228 RepID=UPI0016490E6F|nr:MULTISPECIES: polysaccharide pyruvyl transferase family protein [unclassified Pannonibacter]